MLIGIAIFVFETGMTPSKITFPVGGSVEFENPKKDIVALVVNVIGPDNKSVDDANVWLSIGGEAKKLLHGWEFDINLSKLPLDHKLIVYAERQQGYLKGHKDVTINGPNTVTTNVFVSPSIIVNIKGTVSDLNSEPLAGALVNIVGCADSVVTNSQGFFSLPAHAVEGEEVRLRVSKSGYETKDQYHPAGNVSAYISLRKKQ